MACSAPRSRGQELRHPHEEASDPRLNHVSSRPAARSPQALSSVLQSSSLRPHIPSAAPSRSPTLAYLARQAADRTCIRRARAGRCLSRCHCPLHPPSYSSEHWVCPAAHTASGCVWLFLFHPLQPAHQAPGSCCSTKVHQCLRRPATGALRQSTRRGVCWSASRYPTTKRPPAADLTARHFQCPAEPVTIWKIRTSFSLTTPLGALSVTEPLQPCRNPHAGRHSSTVGPTGAHARCRPPSQPDWGFRAASN